MNRSASEIIIQVDFEVTVCDLSLSLALSLAVSLSLSLRVKDEMSHDATDVRSSSSDNLVSVSRLNSDSLHCAPPRHASSEQTDV